MYACSYCTAYFSSNNSVLVVILRKIILGSCDLIPLFLATLTKTLFLILLCSATITSSSENEERSTSSEVLTKDDGSGVMGLAVEDRHPGLARDNLSAQQAEASPKTEIIELRTPPAPKRPLPQHHGHGTSSVAMPRPNSVAGKLSLNHESVC